MVTLRAEVVRLPFWLKLGQSPQSACRLLLSAPGEPTPQVPMGCSSSNQKQGIGAPQARKIAEDASDTYPSTIDPGSDTVFSPTVYEAWGPSLEPAPGAEATPDEQPLEEGAASPVEEEAGSARELTVPLTAATEHQQPYWQVYLKKWRDAGVHGPVVPPWVSTAMSWVGSFTGIGTLGLIQTYLLPHLAFAPLAILIGSFGAMAVLVFGQPVAPPSQPWNAVCGNAIGALVGVAVYNSLGLLGLQSQLWLNGALAVSLTIVAQELTQSQHPPGGATALLFSLTPNLHALGFIYVLCPACVGAVIIVTLAVLINNVAPFRSYPQSIYPLPNPVELKALLGELETEITKVFNLFDEDGSGEIDSAELEKSLRCLGLDPTKDEVEEIIKVFDDDGSGTMQFEEFRVLMMRMTINPTCSKDDILQAISSGEMDIKHLQSIAKEVREPESAWSRYLVKFKGKGSPPMMRPSLAQTCFSWLGSFVGMAALGALHTYVLPALPASALVLLVGPFGAMSVLLFSTPAASFSQPKNALLGNTLGGVVGVALVKLFELSRMGYVPWLMSALAVSLTIVVQERTASVHPPGGATALTFVLKSCAAGPPEEHPFAIADVWDWYVFCPSFVGTAVLVFVALALNNISEKRKYPARWWS